MTRREAVISVAFGVLCAIAGLVWLWGPLGLIIPGFAIALLVLFVIDIEGQGRGEAVEDAARAARGNALHRQ